MCHGNACAFLLGDPLNFLIDGYLQYTNHTRVALIDVVFEKTLKEEI